MVMKRSGSCGRAARTPSCTLSSGAGLTSWWWHLWMPTHWQRSPMASVTTCCCTDKTTGRLERCSKGMGRSEEIPALPWLLLQTCVIRAWDLSKPLLFCPAMNTAMWEHPITARHVEQLKAFGYTEIPCVVKKLVCGDEGRGAMAEVWTIVERVKRILEERDVPRQS
ncbi:phosphopantothenoylcysteine decarboxylase isoform X2 [Camarhynchus parvulus]|uniref:phosphopantothenoylcysteine decarboxylase isoform X2 n=1 Tax=Geospiza parvula TaxID=87175 RepID=UPI001237B450|nr:phosphopantothenoylcysteine decarboxylase isoform X2 [Camarhynchus parvulus]